MSMIPGSNRARAKAGPGRERLVSTSVACAGRFWAMEATSSIALSFVNRWTSSRTRTNGMAQRPIAPAHEAAAPGEYRSGPAQSSVVAPVSRPIRPASASPRSANSEAASSSPIPSGTQRTGRPSRAAQIATCDVLPYPPGAVTATVRPTAPRRCRITASRATTSAGVAGARNQSDRGGTGAEDASAAGEDRCMGSPSCHPDRG